MTAAIQLLIIGNGVTGDASQVSEELAVALLGIADEAGIGDFTISDAWARLGDAGGTWIDGTASPAVWMPVLGNPTSWAKK
jgi:hypothetical protein